jgi:hypothetical protein
MWYLEIRDVNLSILCLTYRVLYVRRTRIQEDRQISIPLDSIGRFKADRITVAAMLHHE